MYKSSEISWFSFSSSASPIRHAGSHLELFQEMPVDPDGVSGGPVSQHAS